MEFDEGAQLDSSQIEDVRESGGGGFGGASTGGMGFPSGGGGGGIGIPKIGGGLGLVVMVGIVLLKMCTGGGSGLSTLPNSGGGQIATETKADNTKIQDTCKTGADANTSADCELLATINSVQSFWAKNAPANGFQYQPSKTVLFRENVSTGCGAASAAMGPFYCPGDAKVYIDLGFYDEFRDKFGASAGRMARSYVIAHEYGHHIQDILGTNAQVDRSTGADSGSVRLELQADCYAGVWVNHAQEDGFVKGITEADITDGLDAAQKVGDDYIQKKFQGQVNRESWTHGSSAQRQKWFRTGYTTGDMRRCDTFKSSI